VHGLLDVSFEKKGEKTFARVLRQKTPLKVLKPFYPEGQSPCHLYLLNTTAGVLEGDHLEVALHLGEDAEIVLLSPTATKIHHMLSGQARQEIRVTLKRGAVLEYFPEPLLPFSGSAFTQETEVFLEEGATLFWTEILGPGRLEHGESFLYRLYGNEMRISDREGLIAQECFRLMPKDKPLHELGVMEGYSHLGSLYVICADKYHAVLLEAFRSIQMPGLFFGATLLSRRGLMVRALAYETPLLQIFLAQLWAVFRKNVTGRALPPLRKY